MIFWCGERERIETRKALLKPCYLLSPDGPPPAGGAVSSTTTSFRHTSLFKVRVFFLSSQPENKGLCSLYLFEMFCKGLLSR